MSRSPEQLLLGEWACLGILCAGDSHGFAIAARLKPEGDIGRVWALSRALTYRALDQLTARGYVVAVGEEPGKAGGARTILSASPAGHLQLSAWLGTPVEHLRDLRSELLLKLVLADLCRVDVSDMLQRQRAHIARLADVLATSPTSESGGDTSADVVRLWRRELSQAALRFLDAVVPAASAERSPAELSSAIQEVVRRTTPTW
ncbi:MAG: helix-turn-helix transcriptional regulator [Actinomycetota bacterium]|nr:helix-turn-helix transcriptional regulator [Actinomycetota bacterium]